MIKRVVTIAQVKTGRAGARSSAANPKFASYCRESDCELRVQSGTRIIELLVSCDSEVRYERAANSGELRNRDTSCAENNAASRRRLRHRRCPGRCWH